MIADELKRVQSRLIDLGLYHGLVDGVDGPLTDKAVRAFQRMNGLVDDGIVGPKTLARLFPPALDNGIPKINRAGLDLIKEFEGLRLKAYRDSVNVLTVGFGHTSMAGPPEVKSGMTITAQEAEDILARDLGKFEKAVFDKLTRSPTQNEYGAMVSLCFNVGPGNFAKSSVLRKFNEGDEQGAADAFLRWNRADGKVMAGLTRRREAERALFLRP